MKKPPIHSTSTKYKKGTIYPANTMFLNTLYEQPFLFLVFFFILSLWSMLWKGFGLWFSARNEQKGWFLAILIIDLAGLLPIIYLICFITVSPARSFLRCTSCSVR